MKKLKDILTRLFTACLLLVFVSMWSSFPLTAEQINLTKTQGQLSTNLMESLQTSQKLLEQQEQIIQLLKKSSGCHRQGRQALSRQGDRSPALSYGVLCEDSPGGRFFRYRRLDRESLRQDGLPPSARVWRHFRQAAYSEGDGRLMGTCGGKGGGRQQDSDVRNSGCHAGHSEGSFHAGKGPWLRIRLEKQGRCLEQG